MAENELEVRLGKRILKLQAQINSLDARLQRVHREVTHPSVLSRLKAGLGDLLGTTNQVNVANGEDSIFKKDNVTLSLPQDIHTEATPMFAGLIPKTDKDDLGTTIKRWDLYGWNANIYNVLDWSANPAKPKIFSAAAEPNIPDDTFAFWSDTVSGIKYLLLDIGGTQYKIATLLSGINGFGMVVTSGVWTVPIASSIYYFGSKAGLAPQTVAVMAPLYMPKAGVIEVAYIHWMDNIYGGGVAGSNENISVYIRLNDTTDTLVATIGNVSSSKTFSNTALNITTAQGDYIELKIVTPAWATTPVDVVLGGVLYLRNL
jgi:hypothetical protein